MLSRCTLIVRCPAPARVGMEKHAALAAESTDFAYRLDGTCFVVGVHDGNKTGGICNSFCYLRSGDDASAADAAVLR